jgi:6-phosphogluconolactonase (cycloisomerase 2 family)
MVGFDPDNKYLVTADKGLNQMLVFRFDAKTGQLTPNNTPPVMLPARFGTAPLRLSPERPVGVHDQRAGSHDHDPSRGMRKPVA